jgi:hypothetical protein
MSSCVVSGMYVYVPRMQIKIDDKKETVRVTSILPPFLWPVSGICLRTCYRKNVNIGCVVKSEHNSTKFNGSLSR